MAKYASKVVAQAKEWLGKKESDGSFKVIIDTYNSHKPLARGYKVKYADEWCATFVSAVAVELGYTDIIPTECGCGHMIELFKKKGCWVENENRTPEAGDIIFYDWQDSGKGDNKGGSDHVGIVEKVSKDTITAIEGNKGEAVARRTMKVNGKFIRGYGVPKYDAEPKKEEPKKEGLKVDGEWGVDTTKMTQKVLKTPVDGEVSNQLKSCKKYLPNALTVSWEFKASGYRDGSAMVKAIQKLVGAGVDGWMGKLTVQRMQIFLKSKGFYTGKIDGILGEQTVIGWQKYINSRL